MNNNTDIHTSTKAENIIKMKFFLAISALIGAASATVAPNHGFANKIDARKLSIEREFMHAMHADGKIAQAQHKKREQARKRHLYEKLIDAAIPKEQYDKQRFLDQNGEYDMGDSYEWMNPVYQQMVEDGVFDLTARSFKYSGCAAIKAFDADRAAEGASPMVVDTYAVFRLCPEDTCNKYSLTGCGKNYGEYVVEMSTYLQFMLDFYEEHYSAYCDYCYSCDYNYKLMIKSYESACYDNLSKSNYNSAASANQVNDGAWQDYYASHFGDMSSYQAQKQQYQNQMQNQMNNYNNRNLDGYYTDFACKYDKTSLDALLSLYTDRFLHFIFEIFLLFSQPTPKTTVDRRTDKPTTICTKPRRPRMVVTHL